MLNSALRPLQPRRMLPPALMRVNGSLEGLAAYGALW